MKINLLKRNRGFTLVETLVAIAILTLSIVATFTAVQSGLGTSMYARDQVTAFYLIQDAIEYVRSVRDKNILSDLSSPTVDWLTNLTQCIDTNLSSGNVCIVDSSQNTITTSASSPKLLSDSSGRFGYALGGTTTKFTRDVTLQQIATDEVVIIVTIKWQTTSMFSPGNITVKQTMLNTRSTL